eukprot:GHVU01168172.1.p2 GENE.GHVU01168172.1~~GHVU01168172.1.p2  ORF type:complete len:140 (+),score=10.26 GHVU01168172.1:968-1387(+)
MVETDACAASLCLAQVYHCTCTDFWGTGWCAHVVLHAHLRGDRDIIRECAELPIRRGTGRGRKPPGGLFRDEPAAGTTQSSNSRQRGGRGRGGGKAAAVGKATARGNSTARGKVSSSDPALDLALDDIINECISPFSRQ